MLDSAEINELKLRINELKNKIEETEELNRIITGKEDKLRSSLVKIILISAVGYYAGFFIYPPISLASLIFLAGSVIPGGIAVLRYEYKEDKYKEEIKHDQEEMEICQVKLEQLLEEQKNQVTNKTTPIITKEPTITKKTVQKKR